MKNRTTRSIPLTLFVMAALLLNAGIHAQPANTARQESLQQQKTAFFNQKLQLTPTESAKFWPVYNDFQNRRDKIARDRNNLLQYYETNKANMSEKEAGEAIQKYLQYQADETRLLETYTAKFREFLPPKKVMQLFNVELEFKKWLLENLRQNKHQLPARN